MGAAGNKKPKGMKKKHEASYGRGNKSGNHA